jgi:hypothetical protein
MALAEQMQALGTELFERAAQAGQVREGITYLDVEYLLELLGQARLGDARRTAELRQRQLTVIIDGLHTSQSTELAGDPPTWEEQTQRWLPADQPGAPAGGGRAHFWDTTE